MNILCSLRRLLRPVGEAQDICYKRIGPKSAEHFDSGPGLDRWTCEATTCDVRTGGVMEAFASNTATHDTPEVRTTTAMSDKAIANEQIAELCSTSSTACVCSDSHSGLGECVSDVYGSKSTICAQNAAGSTESIRVPNTGGLSSPFCSPDAAHQLSTHLCLGGSSQSSTVVHAPNDAQSSSDFSISARTPDTTYLLAADSIPCIHGELAVPGDGSELIADVYMRSTGLPKGSVCLPIITGSAPTACTLMSSATTTSDVGTSGLTTDISALEHSSNTIELIAATACPLREESVTGLADDSAVSSMDYEIYQDLLAMAGDEPTDNDLSVASLSLADNGHASPEEVAKNSDNAPDSEACLVSSEEAPVGCDDNHRADMGLLSSEPTTFDRVIHEEAHADVCSSDDDSSSDDDNSSDDGSSSDDNSESSSDDVTSSDDDSSSDDESNSNAESSEDGSKGRSSYVPRIVRCFHCGRRMLESKFLRKIYERRKDPRSRFPRKPECRVCHSDMSPSNLVRASSSRDSQSAHTRAKISIRMEMQRAVQLYRRVKKPKSLSKEERHIQRVKKRL